jgi:hypothetical protein
VSRHRGRDPADFRDDENWGGSFYELAIDLGPRSASGADDRLLAALCAIWSDSAVDGPYPDRRATPIRVAPGPEHLEPIGFLYGTATMPSGRGVACATVVVREEGDDAHDWCDLCLPESALNGIGLGLEADSRLSWRSEVDAWLADVARRVWAVAPFALGLIGVEVSGNHGGIDPTAPAPEAERWVGVLVPDGVEVRYLPAGR